MSQEEDLDYDPNKEEVSEDEELEYISEDEMQHEASVSMLQNNQGFPSFVENGTQEDQVTQLINSYNNYKKGVLPLTPKLIENVLKLNARMDSRPRKKNNPEFLQMQANEVVDGKSSEEKKARRKVAKKSSTSIDTTSVQSSPSATPAPTPTVLPSSTEDIFASPPPSLVPPTPVPNAPVKRKLDMSERGGNKQAKFSIENPSTNFLQGTESSNGFKIIGVEKTARSSNPPDEKQVTNGYSIGDNTHVAIVEKRWGGEHGTKNYHVHIERKYVKEKQHYLYTFDFPWINLAHMRAGLESLENEFKKRKL